MPTSSNLRPDLKPKIINLHQILQSPTLHRINSKPPLNLATFIAAGNDLHRRNIVLEPYASIQHLVAQSPGSWIHGYQPFLAPICGHRGVGILFAGAVSLAGKGESGAVANAAKLGVVAVNPVASGEAREPFSQAKEVLEEWPNLICAGLL
nr:hypothetical protein B296_00016864 [Ipomoea batatas]